jgi:hypothetical protein
MPEPAVPTPSARPARLALVGLALALLLTQLPAVAFAEHGGREVGSILNCDRPVTPPRCTSVGDDLRHYVWFDSSLTPELADAMRRAMSGAYSRPTKLSVIEQGRRSAWTDVIAYSADYGDNGAAAWVYCPADAAKGVNPSGDRWCREQQLVFNINPRYAVFFADDASREHVSCHELGHTLGLRHWGNPPETDGPAGATCMNANTPNGPTRLHPTDVDHINGYAYAVERRRTVPALPDPVTAPRLEAVPRLAGTLVGASELERPRSLEALADTADVVVRGRVAEVEAGRVFGPDHHPLHYASVTVEVQEVLVGSADGSAASTLVLEVPLLDGPQGLAQLRAEMVASERVLFLRSKATSAAMAGLPLADQLAERGFHRLVTFGSELVSVGGVAVAAPDESSVLESLDGLPFDEAVARLRALGDAR